MEYISEINWQLSFEFIEEKCWQLLVQGASTSKSPLHLPTVANITDGQPDVRTVVLRKADPVNKQLAFHTDRRSPKWRSLKENPAIAFLFYHPNERVQIRIRGTATTLSEGDVLSLSEGNVFEAAWANTVLSSRRCYLAEKAPSSSSLLPESGLSDVMEARNPTLEESLAGKENFGVVLVKVHTMDWLFLHHKGHRRAFFSYTKQGDVVANWLIP